VSDVRRKKALLAIWIVAGASVLILCGYFFLQVGQDNKSVSRPEKITIAYAAITDTALAQVAQQQGYYLQEGLEVTPLLRSHGKAALDELLAGNADFATVAETPVMFAIMLGEKISIIATIQTSQKNNGIVARKDKGILMPHDLRGRKIAVTRGTTADFFMHAFLAAHGISGNDIKVVDLKPEDMPYALANGDVDAVAAFHPYLIQGQRKLGNRGIIFYDEDIYTQTFNVVAMQEFIRRNPGKIKKLLLALSRAEEFVRQNPAEAQKIVADFSHIDTDLVRELWADRNLSVALDQSLVLALEDESRWAIKAGVISKRKIPNYLDFIYFEGLESARPKAVRILR
jgi:NitT/TauT family transport system substrate-binding protein